MAVHVWPDFQLFFQLRDDDAETEQGCARFANTKGLNIDSIFDAGHDVIESAFFIIVKNCARNGHRRRCWKHIEFSESLASDDDIVDVFFMDAAEIKR